MKPKNGSFSVIMPNIREERNRKVISRKHYDFLSEDSKAWSAVWYMLP